MHSGATFDTIGAVVGLAKSMCQEGCTLGDSMMAKYYIKKVLPERHAGYVDKIGSDTTPRFEQIIGAIDDTYMPYDSYGMKLGLGVKGSGRTGNVQAQALRHHGKNQCPAISITIQVETGDGGLRYIRWLSRRYIWHHDATGMRYLEGADAARVDSPAERHWLLGDEGYGGSGNTVHEGHYPEIMVPYPKCRPIVDEEKRRLDIHLQHMRAMVERVIGRQRLVRPNKTHRGTFKSGVRQLQASFV
jgi:hypothetical protein